jgi:hypothetical protein
MEPAHAANGFVTWAQVEMVRVAENDFRVQGFENVLRYGFDRSGCADRHEHRGFDGSVREMELRAASARGT